MNIEVLHKILSLRSQRWFKETQAKLLRCPTSGEFPVWFHGILSKRKAEKLLADKPQGTFLMHACEKRFGYSLSVRRGDGSCVHHMISQLESTGKYVVIGEPKVYPTLSSILLNYSKVCMCWSACIHPLVMLFTCFWWVCIMRVYINMLYCSVSSKGGGEGDSETPPILFPGFL